VAEDRSTIFCFDRYLVVHDDVHDGAVFEKPLRRCYGKELEAVEERGERVISFDSIRFDSIPFRLSIS
jgi:hypothetical protein